nr:unnamed protein product [Callosobruchus chinensis]
MSKFTSLMVLTYLLSLTYGRPSEGEVEAGGEAKVSAIYRTDGHTRNLKHLLANELALAWDLLSDKSGKNTGFGYSFLEDVLQRVAPVAVPSPDASHGSTVHHNGHHKNHKGKDSHHAKGHHVYGDVSNIDVDTPTVKELEEFRSIGDRKTA